MKLDKEVNKDNVIKKIRGIIEKDSVVLFAYLHGSFLESNNYNDIDVAIYLKQEKGLTPLVMQEKAFKLSSMLEQKYRNISDFEKYLKQTGDFLKKNGCQL